jgi:hypothetical protein
MIEGDPGYGTPRRAPPRDYFFHFRTIFQRFSFSR